MKILIVAIPPGEAPESIRAAWVGIELPVLRRGHILTAPGLGVLTGPRTHIGMLWAWLRRKGERETGYAVSGADAVAALEDKQRQAAAWWREHAPHVTRPGQVLLFRASVCRLIEGTA